MLNERKQAIQAAHARRSYLDKAAPIVDVLAKIESLAGCTITIKGGQIVKSESTYRPELAALREQCLEELRKLAMRFAPPKGNCTFPPGSLTMEKPQCQERPDGSFDVTYPLRYEPAELANVYEMVRDGSHVQVTYPFRHDPTESGEHDHAS